MAQTKTILAGDIGGTKTNLALFAVDKSGNFKPIVKSSFSSKNYPGLEPIAREFLRNRRESFAKACFGVAGPVINGRVKTPNLPWVIDAAGMARELKVKSVALINDLEATAYGIFTLGDDEFFCLHKGAPPRAGNKALIAAGTGLGEAILYDDGEEFRPIASEGGHADFAPRTEIEMELLRYLTKRFGHVSYERVVSGPGLLNVYEFLKARDGFRETPWLQEKLKAADDPSAVISAAALEKKEASCVQALDLFVSIYGAEAGNLALKAKALRGLYIGGGIAPKILDKLRDGTFMRACADKGRYAAFVASIPVQVILNDQAALRGAAYYAARSRG